MSRRGLEFLGTLAGGLLHEIKNPLSTLQINLTLLKEDIAMALPDDRGLGHRIEILEGEVRRLDAILADFMRYAGMHKLKREDRDLAGLVRELVEFVGPGFERDHVHLVARVDSVVVAVDVRLFKQALLNLLLNAQQATRGGGTVEISGGMRDNRMTLTVTDDGCGIRGDEMERVFDVYYSGFGSGSGLGLPTARRILEEHGGGLQLESTHGSGTTVTLWL